MNLKKEDIACLRFSLKIWNFKEAVDVSESGLHSIIERCTDPTMLVVGVVGVVVPMTPLHQIHSQTHTDTPTPTTI